MAEITARVRNGIGEEYEDEYRDCEVVSDREGVRVVLGTSDTGLRCVVVLDAEGRQLYMTGPADRTARERALYYADGYRAAVAERIEPCKGWAYVACPECGMVTTVPLDRTEPLPWCLHSGTMHSWREPHPGTQAAVRPWTRMVRAEVIALEGTNPS